MCDKCDLTFKCPKSLEDHDNSVHKGKLFLLHKTIQVLYPSNIRFHSESDISLSFYNFYFIVNHFCLQGFSTSVINVTTSVVTGPASNNIIKLNTRIFGSLATNANIRPKTGVL